MPSARASSTPAPVGVYEREVVERLPPLLRLRCRPWRARGARPRTVRLRPSCLSRARARCYGRRRRGATSRRPPRPRPGARTPARRARLVEPALVLEPRPERGAHAVGDVRRRRHALEGEAPFHGVHRQPVAGVELALDVRQERLGAGPSGPGSATPSRSSRATKRASLRELEVVPGDQRERCADPGLQLRVGAFLLEGPAAACDGLGRRTGHVENPRLELERARPQRRRRCPVRGPPRPAPALVPCRRH